MDRDIRIIALDLDGTTLNENREFSERTREVFARSMDRGVHIVVATGRAFASLPESMFSIRGLEYVITSNGAVVTRLCDMEKVYTNRLDPVAVEKVVSVIKGRGFSVDAFVDGIAYMEAAELEDIRANGSTFRDVDYVLSTRHPVEDLFQYILDNRDVMENISINFRTDEEKREMGKELSEIEDITLTSSFRHNYEIGGPTTSKADALKHLMGILGLDKSQLMACGDSMNDLEMIKLADIGVAMANADEYTKEHADHITLTNEEDGVAEAIERFVLK